MFHNWKGLLWIIGESERHPFNFCFSLQANATHAAGCALSSLFFSPLAAMCPSCNMMIHMDTDHCSAKTKKHLKITAHNPNLTHDPLSGPVLGWGQAYRNFCTVYIHITHTGTRMCVSECVHGREMAVVSKEMKERDHLNYSSSFPATFWLHTTKLLFTSISRHSQFTGSDHNYWWALRLAYYLLSTPRIVFAGCVISEWWSWCVFDLQPVPHPLSLLSQCRYKDDSCGTLLHCDRWQRTNEKKI